MTTTSHDHDSAADDLVAVSSCGTYDATTEHIAWGPGGHYRIARADDGRGPWQVRREGTHAVLFTGDLDAATAHARRVAAGPSEPKARAFLARVHAGQVEPGAWAGTWHRAHVYAQTATSTSGDTVTIITDEEGAVVEGYYRHQRGALAEISSLDAREAHDALETLEAAQD